MAGLSLNMGIGGVGSTPPANYSNAGTASVMQAAFGPGATQTVKKQGKLSASTPVGMSVYVGIAAVLALVFIRQSLPN